MNTNLLPNVVLPNLPLRKPSSSPLAHALPLSGLTHPAAPNGPGFFLPPGSPITSPVNTGQITSLGHTPPGGLSTNFCNFCGKPANFRCQRCKKTIYCSVECQTEDWKAHRHTCKSIHAELSKAKPPENCASPVLGDKSGSFDISHSNNIQRVFMKDLPSKDRSGTEIQAAIVEVRNPGHFFVVSQSSENLEALQTIAEELQKTHGLPTTGAHKPVVDEVCAVQYSCDMNWYRGLVQHLDADKAHVLYIDFGNEENVPFERIWPLTAKLQEYGPCVIKCCISGVVPSANHWSDKCSIAVKQILEGKIVTVKIFGTLDNGCTNAVDIVLSNGTTLSSFLVEHEYAEKEGVKHHHRTPSEQDINAMVNASQENFKRRSVGIDDNLWAQVPETLAQSVGDAFTVVATHIQSPEKIVVQKVDNAGVIQDLQMNLREHCVQVPASNKFRPAPGTVCCALFSEDKQWYRAKVLAYSSEERVCVGYVDFGNCEDIDLNSLRPISQSLLATPMQAMPCGLAGIQPAEGNWSEECTQALRKRISNRMLRIEIQGSQDGNVFVNLFDENSDPQANIAELLMYAGFAAPVVDKNNEQPTETPLQALEVPVSSPKAESLVWSCVELPPEGQTVLKVCFVESPRKFFCHIMNPADNQRLHEMEAELKSYCEMEASPFDPKLGETCCAIIAEANGRCVRALVKQLCEDEVLVTLVDYGHCWTVKKTHLRPITSTHLSLPFQALPCWLAGVVPEGSDWTTEALVWFQSLVEDGVLSARVLAITEDGYGVELQSKGQNVAAALVAAHFAKFSDEQQKQEVAVVTSSTQNKNVALKRQEQLQKPQGQEQTQNNAAPSQVEVPSFPVDWTTVGLTINETFQPCIAAVSNPSLFYLFGPRQVGEEQIQEMMLQLDQHCNGQTSQPSTCNPVVGAACCARFSADNKWYRAVVLEMFDQEANVIYADYGNSERVPLSSILPISSKFLQLPFQITRCSVVGKELAPAEWPWEVQQMFLGALQHGVIATVQSFDGFSNLLSLSLHTESGEGHVNAMILDALRTLAQNTAGPSADQTLHDETPVRTVSNAEAKFETSPEPVLPPEMPNEVEAVSTTLEDLPLKPPAPPQIPKLGKNTEAAQIDPVLRILKHMEPLGIYETNTPDAIAPSCCCQSLKDKIDHLEQLLQVQISLINNLIAQRK